MKPTPEEICRVYVAAKNRRLTQLGLTDLLPKE
jgi:hypothetical protein